MSDTITVSFPGLGIGESPVKGVAFTLFGKLEVRWYGILITLGIVLAFLYARWRAKRNEGIKSDDVLDVGILSVVLAIVGARLYYVLTSLDHFHSFYDAIAIWEGGLAIYGGLIGGFIGILIMCRVKHIKLLKMVDVIVPGVILAQAIGRWGNFFNGEAYGYEIADTTRYFFFLKEFELPSGSGTLFHALRMGLCPSRFDYFDISYVHPTFLYESVWNLIGFGLINLLYERKRYHGEIFCAYSAWYGFGRMFIEGLRTDSLYILSGVASEDGIRISQLAGLVCFLAGTTAMIVMAVLLRKHPERALPLLKEKRGKETANPSSESAEEQSGESKWILAWKRIYHRLTDRVDAKENETPAESEKAEGGDASPQEGKTGTEPEQSGDEEDKHEN